MNGISKPILSKKACCFFTMNYAVFRSFIACILCEFDVAKGLTLKMATFMDEKRTFCNFPYGRYGTDIKFQQDKRLTWNVAEGAKYFSRKHKLYGVKGEVQFYPQGLQQSVLYIFPVLCQTLTLCIVTGHFIIPLYWTIMRGSYARCRDFVWQVLKLVNRLLWKNISICSTTFTYFWSYKGATKGNAEYGTWKFQSESILRWDHCRALSWTDSHALHSDIFEVQGSENNYKTLFRLCAAFSNAHIP